MKRCHGPLAGTGHGTGGIIPATLRTRLQWAHLLLVMKKRKRGTLHRISSMWMPRRREAA